MSIQVLNYPRKVRTEKERIQAVIASTPTTLNLPFIYITLEQQTANPGIIQDSLASLTSGGVVELGPGTFTLTSPLTITHHNSTLRGAGMNATNLVYSADPNQHLITVPGTIYAVLEDFTISGSAATGNGYGATGTGCGIYIASAAAGSDISHHVIRRVIVFNTPSWAIYIAGAKDWNTVTGYSAVVRGVVYETTIDQVVLAYWNGGGALFSGYGNGSATIHKLLTNGYSFGTYEPRAVGTGVTEDVGQVFLDGTNDYHFTDCYFQGPAAQGGGVPVVHADTDATYLSAAGAGNTTFEQTAFECLSTGAARTHWLITDIGSFNWRMQRTYGIHYRSNEPPRIFKQPNSAFVSSQMIFEDCHFFEPCDFYAGTFVTNVNTNSTNVLTLTAGDTSAITIGQSLRGFTGTDIPVNVTVTNKTLTTLTISKAATGTSVGLTMLCGPVPPYVIGDTTAAVRTRDDFIFSNNSATSADSVGHTNTPLIVRNVWIHNSGSGKTREPATPAFPTTGNGVHLQKYARFENGGWLRLPVFDCPDAPVGGTAAINSLVSRLAINHAWNGGPGTLGYVFDTEYADQRDNGLWIVDRGLVARHVPFYRNATTADGSPALGDLWYDQSQTAFKTWDGSAWQTGIKRSLGTAAGDLIKYTASDTPARLAIGSTGDVLTVAGGLPTWAAITQDFADNTFLVHDNGDTSKKLAVECSGLTTATTRTLAIQDTNASVVVVGNAAAASGTLGRIALTGQTGSLGAQTLLTGNASSAGVYCIAFYIKTTTAVVASSLTVTVSWNDGTAQSLVVPFVSALTLTNNHDLATNNAYSQSEITVKAAASQNITFITTQTSAGAPVYTLDARITALG